MDCSGWERDLLMASGLLSSKNPNAQGGMDIRIVMIKTAAESDLATTQSTTPSRPTRRVARDIFPTARLLWQWCSAPVSSCCYQRSANRGSSQCMTGDPERAISNDSDLWPLEPCVECKGRVGGIHAESYKKYFLWEAGLI